MVEWGAVLGAMLMTLIAARDGPTEAHDAGATIAAVFVVAPIIGAVWGALVAGIIHFTADGTLPRFVIGFLGLMLRALTT